MHDTVTRNHRCHSLYELCQDVKRFFIAALPFPGAQHGVAEFRSVIWFRIRNPALERLLH